jgi:hypothetical protein
MLSGVRRANAINTCLVVQNCVETYTFDRTPHTEADDHSSAILKLIISVIQTHSINLLLQVISSCCLY